MPIWFQINRLRVWMPFWHITAVKLKCFFFLILSCHFTSLRSWQRHPLPSDFMHKAVRLHAEFAIAFFSCFRRKVCVWRHVSWQGLTFVWACLLVTALRNLICTGVYLMRKATDVGLKDWVSSSSILTANVWNAPPAHKPASDHYSF